MLRIRGRRLFPILTLLFVAGLAAACGPAATDAPESESPDTAPPPSPTDPPAPTAVPPTSTPAASPTPEPLVVVYEDPEGDCLDNSNNPAVCNPVSVDILTVTVSEESPLKIMIEVAEPGFEELRANGIFGATFGIDVDRDPTTGNTNFWPIFHLLGPDIEVHWFEEDGEVVAEGVTQYAPDGTMTEGDASLATWTVLDETHLQVVLADGLVDSASFGIAGDLFTPLVYDHFVDDGHITFPEGDVNLVE